MRMLGCHQSKSASSWRGVGEFGCAGLTGDGAPGSEGGGVGGKGSSGLVRGFGLSCLIPRDMRSLSVSMANMAVSMDSPSP